ncbi:MAG: hypothetical protein HY331_07765 [Chloroflexi bacterium]|nr:hypothetical protein [Chloroflexota bacterium]
MDPRRDAAHPGKPSEHRDARARGRLSRRRFLYVWTAATGGLLAAACGGGPAPAPTAVSVPTPVPTQPARPTQVPIAIATSAPAPAPSPTVQAAATAVPAAKPGGVKVFRVAFEPDVQNMDPAKITGAPDYQLGEAIYNFIGRYTYNPPLGTKINPELAEWEIKDGAKTYIFHIRKGVKFQGGFGDLTAEDVKWNWERIADQKSGSRYYTDFAGSEIKALDQYTVQVRFPNAYPAFIPASLAFRPGLIVSPKAFKERGDKWKTAPVGSGPFEWVDWQVGSQVTLKRFEGYWGTKPKVDRIIMKTKVDDRTTVLAVAKGELDAFYIDDPDVALDVAKNTPKGAKFFKAEYGQSPYWLAYNMKKKPFDDIRVRQALRYAIDNEAIARDLYGGLADPIASFLPPFMFGYSADVPRFKYNPDTARKLLKEAGVSADWAPGVLGQGQSSIARKITEAVVSMWNDVGVKAKADIPEYAAFLKRRAEGDYDVFGIGVGRIEPDQIATPYWRSNSPVNNSFYTAGDDLIDQAKAEPDPDKRAKLYRDLQAKISQDSPAAFIVATSGHVLVNNRVSGVSGSGWQTRYDWFSIDVPAE